MNATMKSKNQQSDLPFQVQDALDKIQLPKQKKPKRFSVIVGILIVHLILAFLLQDKMMRNARLLFKPEIVYATIIPPAVTPASAPSSASASSSAVKPASQTKSTPAASQAASAASASAASATTIITTVAPVTVPVQPAKK